MKPGRPTPVIEAQVGNQWLLGSLPDGGPVVGAVGAYSAAAGPIVADGDAWGAITSSGARPGCASGSSSLISCPTSRIQLVSRPGGCGAVSLVRSGLKLVDPMSGNRRF